MTVVTKVVVGLRRASSWFHLMIYTMMLIFRSPHEHLMLLETLSMLDVMMMVLVCTWGLPVEGLIVRKISSRLMMPHCFLLRVQVSMLKLLLRIVRRVCNEIWWTHLWVLMFLIALVGSCLRWMWLSWSMILVFAIIIASIPILRRVLVLLFTAVVVIGLI